MTVSLRVMSAGEGYRYLLFSVAAMDADRPAGRFLGEYYTMAGTPPGYWIGSGVGQLGGGSIQQGDRVEEDQLRRLLGEGRDPVSGVALGRAYPQYARRAERVAARVAQLDVGLTSGRRAAAVAAIEVEEAGRRVRRAVAGFDLTFSAPKSVSVLWALADEGVREQVLGCHRVAVAATVGLFEGQVAATRMGVAAADGAVAQVGVKGVAATAFEHWDSRAGDPQLHTHVVVSNKVRTTLDGRWRSLDSRPVHGSVVAMSEFYNAVLADRLTAALGVGWEPRDRGRDRSVAWEIAGVEERLIAAFSTRAGAIEAETARLVAGYAHDHGRQPSARVVIRLRQQATLATRPDKTVRSLADLRGEWVGRAAGLGVGPFWDTGILDREAAPVSVLSAEDVARLGGRVVEVVGERRSTWRYWNLHAEASRQTAGIRFTTTQGRNAAVLQVVAAAEQASVRLTPSDLAGTPAVFRRVDGTSVFRPARSTVYTSAGLLAAEDRLIRLAEDRSGPTVPTVLVDPLATAGLDVRLGDDQAGAVRSIIGSGRMVDALVGPAGAGKTTTMSALREVWETVHGPGSVVGLAPSAAAAAVLGEDLGIGTENTAKWLHDHTAGHTASLAGHSQHHLAAGRV